MIIRSVSLLFKRTIAVIFVSTIILSAFYLRHNQPSTILISITLPNYHFHPNATRNFSLDYLPILNDLHLLEGDNYHHRIISKTDRIALNATPVFISGWSNGFTYRGYRLCESIMKYSPMKTEDKKLIVYNLGISSEEMKSYLNRCPIAQFRAFNFSKYPDYVAHLQSYRWKPLIIAEALIDFPAILWMDSSMIFKSQDSMQPYYDSIRFCTNDCLHFALFGYSSHSIFAATHPQMFEYLPMSIKMAQTTDMYEASHMLWYSTTRTRVNLLKWLVWCALDRDCMGPNGTRLGCSFPNNDRNSTYANCHRFDQSAVNIIAAFASGFDPKLYRYDNAPLLTSR